MDTTRRTANYLNSSGPVDVLLVTVTEVEANAVFDAFTPGQQKQRRFIGDNTYYDLGVHGGACVLMVQSEMGSGGLAGTQATVQASIEALHPNSVVMVGIAFGVDLKKQKTGDILVSRQLMPYEHQRVGTDKNGKLKRILRGERAHASVRLVDRFTSGLKDWKGQKVEIGLVLSGEKLVDNFRFRQQLLKLEPEAIGGEMEGAGLYAAAQRAKVDWILVKAICDWADGYKSRNKKGRQQLAAQNAASFVLHVLQLGGLVDSPAKTRSASNVQPVHSRSSSSLGSKQNSRPKATAGRRKLGARIPSSLFNQIRRALLDCGPFDSDGSLASVFADPRLIPFRNSVPQASNQDIRVGATMALLTQFETDPDRYPLLLLLRVLREQIDEEHPCHPRLRRLEDELKEVLCEADTPPVPASRAGQPSTEPGIANNRPS